MTTCMALAIAGALAYGSGVMLPPDREWFADGALVVTAGGAVPVAEPVSTEAYYGQLPQDDRGKWVVTLWVDSSSQASALLQRDFRQHPALAALAQWGKFETIDVADPSQAERVKRWKIGKTPSVSIVPYPGNPQFPYTLTFYAAGYGGDAEKLAMDAWSALRTAYAKAGVQQCPGPGPCPLEPDRPYDDPDRYPDRDRDYGPDADRFPSSPALPDQWPPAKPSLTLPAAMGWKAVPWILLAGVGVWLLRGRFRKAAAVVLLVVSLTPLCAASTPPAKVQASSPQETQCGPPGGVLERPETVAELVRSDLFNYAERQRDTLERYQAAVEVNLFQYRRTEEHISRLATAIGAALLVLSAAHLYLAIRAYRQ